MIRDLVLAILSTVLLHFTMSMSWLAASGAAIVVCLFVWYFQRRLRDPYGSFHIALNVVDPASNAAPTTEWLNMGYWKVSTVNEPYPCKPLIIGSTIRRTRMSSRERAKVWLRHDG